MSILMSYGKADFTFLKKKLGLSDGNLGAHIRKLEEAEYIVVEKTSFAENRERSVTRARKASKLTKSILKRWKKSLKESDIMIEVKKAGKTYGSKRVLEDVHLSIDKGACFGLLGPNGAENRR